MLTIALEASSTFDKQVKAAIIGEMREEPARMVVGHTQFDGTAW